MKYEGPSAAHLEAAGIVAPIVRSMKTETRERRVKVYSRETGEVLGESTVGEAIVGLMKAHEIEIQVDEDTRPTEVICEACGATVKVKPRGPRIPKVCIGGCLCSCKKRKVHRASALRAVLKGASPVCRACAQAVRTPEQLSNASRKGQASRTTEQRAETVRRLRAGYAAMTPERHAKRAEALRDWHSALTPAQRSENLRAARAARRANAAKKVTKEQK